MPKLKPATQAARREHILDSAEVCFAKAGFHGTSMQDICREAAVSPGALYVYFSSKEDLIAGIAERDRALFQTKLEAVAQAPDLVSALQRLAEHYTLEQPQYKRQLLVEIGAESTRNPTVGSTFRAVDRFVVDSFAALLERARTEGRIDPTLEPATLARVLHTIGDGVFWRRAVDPEFDARAIMPTIMQIVAHLLRPVEARGPDPAVYQPKSGDVPVQKEAQRS